MMEATTKTGAGGATEALRRLNKNTLNNKRQFMENYLKGALVPSQKVGGGNLAD